jgi:hypothetical protein
MSAPILATSASPTGQDGPRDRQAPARLLSGRSKDQSCGFKKLQALRLAWQRPVGRRRNRPRMNAIVTHGRRQRQFVLWLCRL